MSSASSIAAPFQSGWFDVGPTGTGGVNIAVVKSEFQEAFSKAVAEERVQRRAEAKAWLASNSGVSAALTPEQAGSLAGKYDPNRMSQEDYRAFVDELCAMGVLEEEDKHYLSYGGLTKLDLGGPNGYVVASTPDALIRDTLSGSGGNALDWARFRASYQAFDPDTGAPYRDRAAVLFGQIAEILEQVQLASK